MSAISVSGVEKRYGSVEALKGVSFEIARGEMFGLIGPDGAGKTTSIRLICGLLHPDAGEIRVLDQDPVRQHAATTQAVGYLSQRFSLYGDLSIDENIAFFAEIHGVADYHDRRDRLLEMTQLTQFRSRRADRLSGGMKQKLALACTLVHEPDVLMLDEPTTGVDPVARREFNDTVASMAAERGTTVFMSSHLVDEVEGIAIRVGIVQAGRTSIEGRVDELRDRVRRVRSSVPLDPPQGFARVRGDVWLADGALWGAAAWPEGTSVEPLQLEEIFLAFARTDAPAAGAVVWIATPRLQRVTDDQFFATQCA